MAGAGLRPSELNAGEGERGLLLHEPWVPMHRSENNLATQRGEGQSKNTPGPFSCWAGTEVPDPPRMLTQGGIPANGLRVVRRLPCFASDVDAEKAAFMADSQLPWGVAALSGKISEPAWRAKPS